jgi:hypothetical protein
MSEARHLEGTAYHQFHDHPGVQQVDNPTSPQMISRSVGIVFKVLLNNHLEPRSSGRDLFDKKG